MKKTRKIIRELIRQALLNESKKQDFLNALPQNYTPRDMKKAWAVHSDTAFWNRCIYVHWDAGIEDVRRKIFSMYKNDGGDIPAKERIPLKSRDEISCCIYAPGEPTCISDGMIDWLRAGGEDGKNILGFIIEGHVTIAGSDLASGFHYKSAANKKRYDQSKKNLSRAIEQGSSEEYIQKKKDAVKFYDAYSEEGKHRIASSGWNKSPRVSGARVFLSEEDFISANCDDHTGDPNEWNEALIDNWKVVGIIVPEQAVEETNRYKNEEELAYYISRMMKHVSPVPIFDEHLNHLV